MTEPACVLIDTSAWILALRPKGPDSARVAVEELLTTSRAATARIIMLELLSGTRSTQEFRELKEELSSLQQLDLTPHVWEKAFDLGYQLRRAGLTLPTVDILISALALENDCTLLHADRHFEQVAKHHPLKPQNLL
ncbi:PIN domain nuclease [Candidatus Acetothermia bacterium]|nr:PIN domain nuclease [Candidatus Acetothermia bacterium]